MAVTESAVTSAEHGPLGAQACLRRGLIVEPGGRHAGVVRLLPPLTMTDEQADAVLDRLTDAVRAVSRNHAALPRAHGPSRGSPRRHDAR